MTLEDNFTIDDTDRSSFAGNLADGLPNLSVSFVSTMLMAASIVFLILLRKPLQLTFKYQLTLAWYWIRDGSYEECPYFKEDQSVRAYLFSVSLVSFLWDLPHYRSGTFKNDMVKNLRNVALPGTGVPLSMLCFSKYMAMIMIALLFPIVQFIYAVVLTGASSWTKTCNKYEELLLRPKHWFAFWRINCRLASYHAFLTKANGYSMEDKWTFLTEAEKAGVPISPVLDIPSIIVKDRNEEGGMGIHVYNNARHQGRWIIQPRLLNGAAINKWLPDDAPLSTFRVITASDSSLDVVDGQLSTDLEQLKMKTRSLSCVFRAGRSGANTDHESILFDIDQSTGLVKEGTTNAHWYKLGLHSDLFSFKPAPFYDAHPDSQAVMSGTPVDDIEQICKIAEDAHAKLLPDVPLCGWDVAVTREHGLCLLEVNLSCNFFNGTFDRDQYFQFIHNLLLKLDQTRRSRTVTPISDKA